MTYQLRSCSDLASNIISYLPNIPNWRQVVIPCLKAFNLRHPAFVNLIASGIVLSVIEIAHAVSSPAAEESFSTRSMSPTSRVEGSLIQSCLPPELLCMGILHNLFGSTVVPFEFLQQCVQSVKDQPPSQCI